jgi:hypothetical protein
MNGKGYQGHKGGKRYNGGVPNSKWGFDERKGYQGYDEQPSYGYGQRQEGNQSKPKENYSSQGGFNKHYKDQRDS